MVEVPGIEPGSKLKPRPDATGLANRGYLVPTGPIGVPGRTSEPKV